jgi:hypothetical protein
MKIKSHSKSMGLSLSVLGITALIAGCGDSGSSPTANPSLAGLQDIAGADTSGISETERLVLSRIFETPLEAFNLESSKFSLGYYDYTEFHKDLSRDCTETGSIQLNASEVNSKTSRDLQKGVGKVNTFASASMEMAACRFREYTYSDTIEQIVGFIEYAIEGTYSGTRLQFESSSVLKLKIEATYSSEGERNTSDINTESEDLVIGLAFNNSLMTELKEISNDPMGYDAERQAKIEFWTKHLKCSGSVKIGIKTLTCAQALKASVEYSYR